TVLTNPDALVVTYATPTCAPARHSHRRSRLENDPDPRRAGSAGGGEVRDDPDDARIPGEKAACPNQGTHPAHRPMVAHPAARVPRAQLISYLRCVGDPRHQQLRRTLYRPLRRPVSDHPGGL